MATMPWPTSFDSPVLESLRPVVETPRDVHTNLDKVRAVASWMAYEELPFPEFVLPFGVGSDPRQAMDFMLVSACLNFAFTDFEKHTIFQLEYQGKRWYDAEAMFAGLKRAVDRGVPVLDGNTLKSISEKDLEKIFEGETPMPMLEERAEILRAVGAVLAEKYGGHFYNFVESAPRRLYQDGKGILERLVREFPRFNDVSPYDGHTVKIYKLGQLGLWMLHSGFHRSGTWQLEDIERMTAFADYIVPMALRVMGVLEYSPALAERIDHWQPIPRDSTQEVEIRAHTLYSTALLTEEINRLRPADRQVIIPQIDARFWTHYHNTFLHHHLTRTIMY